MAAPFLAFWQASQSKTELADRSAGVSDSSTTHNDPPSSSGEPITRKRSRKHKSRKSHASPPPTPFLADSDDLYDLDDFSLTLDGHVQQKQAKPQKSMTLTNTGSMFPSFLDTNTGSGPNSNMQRASPLGAPQPQHQVNGAGGGMNGMGSGMNNGMSGLPMNAGQQMDVNMLYQKVLELSDVLRENRERTQGIVAGAGELATRAAANGASPSLQEANEEISAARIADLERQLAREQNKTRTILREQKENTKLIGEYETAVGNIVEMVRNYSFNNKAEKTSLQLHYNKLLQEEKDAHLEARLEKDHWHSKFMRSVEMLREAYRLRCEEEEVPTRIVAGLQNEVRAYRSALGMEREKPEEEFGWEVLKDVADRED